MSLQSSASQCCSCGRIRFGDLSRSRLGPCRRFSTSPEHLEEAVVRQGILNQTKRRDPSTASGSTARPRSTQPGTRETFRNVLPVTAELREDLSTADGPVPPQTAGRMIARAPPGQTPPHQSETHNPASHLRLAPLAPAGYTDRPRGKQTTKQSLRRPPAGLTTASPSPAPRGQTATSPSPVYIPDLSRMSPRATERRPVAFSGFDLFTALPIYRRKGAMSTSNPYFDLVAIPSEFLPKQPPSAFPQDYHKHKISRADKSVTFLMVASKVKVSKLAVERGRAKRRFKAALDLVANRGVGLRTRDGADLVRPDKVYFAFVKAEIVSAPFEALCKSLVEALGRLRLRPASVIPPDTRQRRR